jgi:hypothetical protein
MHLSFTAGILPAPVLHFAGALHRSGFAFVAASRHQLLFSQSGASASVPHVQASSFLAIPSRFVQRLRALFPLCAEHVPVALSQLFVALHLLVVAGSPVFVHQQMSSLSPSLHSAAFVHRV